MLGAAPPHRRTIDAAPIVSAAAGSRKEESMNVELKRMGVAALVLVLAACGSAAPATPLVTATTSPEEMATAFYQTLQAPTATLPATAAGPTETLGALPTTGTQGATQAAAGTAQPGATATPTRAATLKGPVKPPVGGDGCMLQAEFVEDITVPDDTTFKPNEGFKKTWELKNIGTCTWDTKYELFYYPGGDPMEGPESVKLTEAIEPGDTVRLTVPLRAPSAPGTYFSYWMLRDSYGVQFGTEACGCVPFWAKIIVSTGATPTP
jgi:hypothetical protein